MLRWRHTQETVTFKRDSTSVLEKDELHLMSVVPFIHYKDDKMRGHIEIQDYHGTSLQKTRVFSAPLLQIGNLTQDIVDESQPRNVLPVLGINNPMVALPPVNIVKETLKTMAVNMTGGAAVGWALGAFINPVLLGSYIVTTAVAFGTTSAIMQARGLRASESHRNMHNEANAFLQKVRVERLSPECCNMWRTMKELANDTYERQLLRSIHALLGEHFSSGYVYGRLGSAPQEPVYFYPDRGYNHVGYSPGHAATSAISAIAAGGR